MNLKAVLTALAQVRAVQGNRTTAAMAMTPKVFFAPKHQLTIKLTIDRRMLVSAKFSTSLTMQEYVDAAIGPKVDDQVAKIMNKRWGQRMDIKLLKEKMAKYNRPENCDLIRVPRVNAPVWKSLDSYRRRQDVKLSNIQKTCVAVGASMAYTLDMLYKNKEKTELDIPALMRSLADTAAMLGHVNIDLSLVRREVMRPTLNTEYRNLCNPDHPVTSWLFGDDLQKEMKDVKETNKIGNQMTQRSTASYRYHQQSQGSSSRQYGYNKDFYRGARPRTRYKKFPPKSKAKPPTQ